MLILILSDLRALLRGESKLGVGAESDLLDRRDIFGVRPTLYAGKLKNIVILRPGRLGGSLLHVAMLLDCWEVVLEGRVVIDHFQDVFECVVALAVTDARGESFLLFIFFVELCLEFFVEDCFGCEVGLFMFGIVYFFYAFDCADGLDELAGDFAGLLVIDMFDFDLKKHVKGVSDFFRPMVVEFEEDFAHEIHGDLVPGVGVEELKVVVNYDQQTVNRVVVLAFDNHPDYLEKVVLVKGVRKRGCLLLCHHLQVLVDQVQHDLHLVPIIDVGLVTNQWQHRCQQVLVF